MARQKITEKTVANLKTSSGRIEVWDSLLPGFGVRVTSRGVKSWFAFTRVSGKPVRVTLGRYPVVGLSEARKAARVAIEGAPDAGRLPPQPPQSRRAGGLGGGGERGGGE